MKMPKPIYSGFTLAFIAVSLFSSKSIFIKWAYQYGVDTTTLLTLRMLIALPFYAGILIFMLKKPASPITNLTPNSLMSMIALGILGYYAASWLDLKALNFISAHYERLVLYTYPAFVLIINLLWQKKRIKRSEMIALTIAYSGLLLIFVHDLNVYGETILMGTLLVLASSFCFSFYVVGSQKYSTRYGSKFFTCVAMLAASLAIFIHFLINNQLSDLVQPWQVIGLAFAIAMLATVIPSFLMNAAIEQIGANNAAISGSLGPVLTTGFAILLLDEEFTWLHAFGMFLVIFGIYFLIHKSAIKSKT
ncbi:DMT family transporter [Catenovulum adriaticum]|uniref:DMT family transporter n=1 Tax=Catenovulum adriaticum TaxID=2984846 RepID=A0ABY7AMB5_9ALTE|nr:DMT family transporter [Catenovulum sp. TS8]WAJ70358.1 DMT family transporter [Catenovulum sp. TS8]